MPFLLSGLVSVVHQNFISDLAEQAMEALLVLHQPPHIMLWNTDAPLPMFWDTSSSVLFSISQKLIQHQIVNYCEVLKWLREILKCRNVFLMRYKDVANQGTLNFFPIFSSFFSYFFSYFFPNFSQFFPIFSSFFSYFFSKLFFHFSKNSKILLKND